MPIDFTPASAAPAPPSMGAQPDNGSSRIDFSPAPKLPDMSGVRKMAQKNLASDSTEGEGEDAAPKPAQTPAQRLDTAVGMPMGTLLNPTDNNPLPAPLRRNLTKAYANGDADNAGDFMQSAFHQIGDVVKTGGSEIGKMEAHLLTSTPQSLMSDVIQNTLNLPVQGLTRLLGRGYQLAGGEMSVPVAEALTQGIPEFGGFKGQKELRSALEEKIDHKPETAAGEVTQSTIGIAPYLAGGEGSALRKGVGALASGGGTVAGGEIARQAGFGEKGQQVGQILGGAPGMVYGAHTPAVREAVAAKIGKEPSAVTPEDVDHALSVGATPKAPAAQDFKTVEKFSGGELPEKVLHTIYNETGIKPDQVYEDAKANPAIAEDIAKDKVPEAYEPFMDQREAVEELKVARSDTSKSFNIVDENGDYVHGGFDSAEEAQHFIEDKQTGEIPDEPPEWKVGQKGGLDVAKENHLAETYEKIGRGEQVPWEDREAAAKWAADTGLVKEPEHVPLEELNAAYPDRLKSEIKFSEWKDIGGGYSIREGTSHPIQEIRTPEGNSIMQGLDDKGRLYKEWEFSTDKNPMAKGAMAWADRAMSELREKMSRPKLADEHSFSDFLKRTEGSASLDVYRKATGEVIQAAEKFAGKMTGDLFHKIGESYVKTFAPELAGDKALRADAFMAKYKAASQEAEHAFYTRSKEEIRRWDKATPEDRMNWLYDHETGRWSKDTNPDHARYQAILDAAYKLEKDSGASQADYKENYLPHAWLKPDAVKAYFNSDAYIKKYGKDGFTKRSTFQLIQDGIRAGFKLKTDNPERMLVNRLLAGQTMVRTMDLLHDLQSSGIAVPARSFSLEKRAAKTKEALAEAEGKYKAADEKINDPAQYKWDWADPIVTKYMKGVQKRIDALKERATGHEAEKAGLKLTPEQMKSLKTGFRVIGPDSKVWNIDQEVGPLWKNAMEMKGLWERDGLTGDGYRSYMQGKAIWVQAKLGLSLFHPMHVLVIDAASHLAASAEHLIKGGKLSDLIDENHPIASTIGKTLGTAALNKENFKGRDHHALQAWNTAPEARTPEQQETVRRMVVGGFKPTMSARDTIHFKENFDKAIAKVGVNNLRLLGTAASLPGGLMKPFFEHWIPGGKSEIYLRRFQSALDRDPTLAKDAGREAEMARAIAKDTDRTYGEMNNSVQFWNRNVRDSFNAAFISGGWKLAQIYNARGLVQPAHIAYKYLKTGEFSKEDITYNMLQSYAYTGLTLALGGTINAALGNPIGKANDTVWDMVKNLVAPQTGDKNPDGTPIRLNQPAFAKEAYMLAKDINQQGLLAGAGHFLYHQTLIPGIVDTLNNRDFVGRKLISDPMDLHQWMNAGWDAINPISMANYEKASTKHSTVGLVAGAAGFPIAGAYLNQTPFEQKVLYTYQEQHPPTEDAYTAKLKANLRGYVANGDKEAAEKTRAHMKDDGMSSEDISRAEKVYTKPFVEDAWKKLPEKDQKRLIDSASDEERKRFKVKQ